MKKKGVLAVVLVISVLFISLSFISAGFWGNFFNKITGKVVDLNDGLIAYYPFNGNANDMSGNGKNGNVYGATSITGVDGQAYSFDGVDDYIQAPTSTRLSTATVSVWVMVNELPTNRAYAITSYAQGGQSATSHDKNLEVGTDGKFSFYIWDGSAKSASSNTVLELGKWYHVVGITDGSQIKIYVNGVFQNSASTGTSWTNGNTFVFGFVKSSVYSSFKGGIDEVKLYNRALNAEEVLALYNETRNQTAPIACYTNTDCGINTTTRYCNGSYACISTTGYTCVNPGTTSSYCSSSLSGGCAYCANGCSGGNCIQNQTNVTCIDSDGGLNYYVKGYTGVGNYSDWDWCDSGNQSNLLMEKYCISSTTSGTQSYFCPNGCLDGACVQNQTNVYYINSCGNLNQPGTYYLSRDIYTNNTCITINSSDITIDGQGYSINGNPYVDFSDEGITSYVVPYYEIKKNITIKNTIISGFGKGIHLIYDDNLIYNNYFSDNGESVNIEGSNNFIANNEFANYDGIVITYSSKDNKIMNNRFLGGIGIQIRNNKQGHNLIENNIYNGEGYFLVLAETDNNMIINSTISGNYANGIQLFFNSENNTFKNNIICSGRGSAFFCEDSDNNYADNNTFDSRHNCAWADNGKKNCTQNPPPCTPVYSCSINPLLCPPSGIQTKTCVDTQCGTPDVIEQLTCTPGECGGCNYNDRCLPIGTRVTDNSVKKYCDVSGELTAERNDNAECDNNYECKSNICSDGTCIGLKTELAKAGFFRQWVVRTLCRLSHLFDTAEGYNECVASYIEEPPENVTGG